MRNNQNGSGDIQNVLAQMANGQKLQSASDDANTFVDSLRLNDEEVTLNQVKETTIKSLEFANNTDSVMSQFDESFTSFKTKLLQAANDTNSDASREAIAKDLEGIKDHMKSLANTSINGQYLFSGSLSSVQPIDDNGVYQGNNQHLRAVVGKDVEQPYNIDGQSLFSGTDSNYQKKISTNMVMYNQNPNANGAVITAGDTIKDLVGDSDTTDSANLQDSTFYVRGRDSDGNAIKTKILLNSDDKVSSLIDKIGEAYGNSATSKVVDVSLNDYGQIEITDLKKGNSLIDFHIVGAVDDDNVGINDSNVADIDDIYTTADVRVIDFMSSNYKTVTGVNDTYDRTMFTKDEATLTSNISQRVKSTNTYANHNTTLLATSGTTSLAGTDLDTSLTQTDGTLNTNASMSLGLASSTFTLDGVTNFDIFDEVGVQTAANDVTYQQLMDVTALMVTGITPTANTAAAYNTAVETAKNSVDVYLDDKGRMSIHEKASSSSRIEFSLFDKETDTFDGLSTAPNLSFMSNNAITVDEPEIDLFEQLDQIIASVRAGTQGPDSTGSDPRNLGIQNAIDLADHLSIHFNTKHAEIGAYTNALEYTQSRSEVMSLNITQVKHDLLDADLAELALQYQQMSLSYEAMLSTVGKVNQLSLVNYL